MTDFYDIYGKETKENKFLVQKLNRVFKMKDFRKIGRVDEQDYFEWGSRAAGFAGVKYTHSMMESWKNAWQAFFGVGYESRESWVKKTLAFSSMENKIEISRAIHIALIKCVDLDGDGICSWTEFAAFVMPLGVSEHDAKAAFAIIDTNKNGVIDEMEFAEAISRYYLDTEPNPFENVFGVWAKRTPDNHFLNAKLARIFDMQDRRKIGKVEARDFVAWGRKCAQFANVKFTDEMSQRWKNAWAAFYGKGYEGKRDWVKKMLEFGNMENNIVIGKAIIVSLFKCVDLDGDGVCTWTEFAAFVMPLGIDEEDAKKAFEIIDLDGKGTIDDMEFAEACAHYYFDPKRSAYENFYGVWEWDKKPPNLGRQKPTGDDFQDNKGKRESTSSNAQTAVSGESSCCAIQ